MISLDDFDDCNNYSYNNNCCNYGGAIGIVVFLVLYPYLPFAVVGYEVCNTLSNGLNIVKWTGAILGALVGFVWYAKYFSAILFRFNIKSEVWFWILSYILASIFFCILHTIFPNNEFIKAVWSLYMAIFNWCFSR